MLILPHDERLLCFAPQPVDRRRAELRLERFPACAREALADQVGPLANLRSSTGCFVELCTDSPTIAVRIASLRHHQPYPVSSDLELLDDAGGTLSLLGGEDLRGSSGACTLRFATGAERGAALRRCRLHLPLISACAIAGIEVADGSRLAQPPPVEPAWLAIGDSLTQGFRAQHPTATWFARLSRSWGLPVWNLGLAGLRVVPTLYDWALGARHWRLITVTLGSNHAWSAAATETLRASVGALLERLALSGAERICWLLPGWKPFEAGAGPSHYMGVPLDAAAAERLQRIRGELAELIAAHPAVKAIDDLLPEDERLYPDGLHPDDAGHGMVAKRVGEVVAGSW